MMLTADGDVDSLRSDLKRLLDPDGFIRSPSPAATSLIREWLRSGPFDRLTWEDGRPVEPLEALLGRPGPLGLPHLYRDRKLYAVIERPSRAVAELLILYNRFKLQIELAPGLMGNDRPTLFASGLGSLSLGSDGNRILAVDDPSVR